MSIQILSDLHLESPKAYDVFEITPRAPYLALVGDIGTVVAHKADFLAFLKRQLSQFRAVLFVPGNHEAYHSTWTETLQTLREFEEEVRGDDSSGEFVLLDRGSFRVPGCNTVVLGCSLFSHVPEDSHESVSFGINDFYHTEGWDVAAHNAAHARDLAWLNDEVTALEKTGEDTEIVIMTHWSPSRDPRASDPRHGQSPIAGAFSTDLSRERCFASLRTKMWVFGHTHFNCDFGVEREGGRPLRVVANQRGYYFSQAAGFDPEMVLEM